MAYKPLTPEEALTATSFKEILKPGARVYSKQYKDYVDIYKFVDRKEKDTEGTEYQILNNYNWQIMPSILKVEHKHWGSHGEDKNKYITFLKDKNYIVYEEENDLYCIQ